MDLGGATQRWPNRTVDGPTEAWLPGSVGLLTPWAAVSHLGGALEHGGCLGSDPSIGADACPNGEANLGGGGYVCTAIGSGRGQRYSEKDCGRRWMDG